MCYIINKMQNPELIEPKVLYREREVISTNQLFCIYGREQMADHGPNDYDTLHAYFTLNSAPEITLQFLQEMDEHSESDGWVKICERGLEWSYPGHRKGNRVYLSGDHCNVFYPDLKMKISLRKWRLIQKGLEYGTLLPFLLRDVTYAKNSRIPARDLMKQWNIGGVLGDFRIRLMELLDNIDSLFKLEGKREKTMLLHARLQKLNDGVEKL
jgi:hypothetical protein